MIKMKIFCLNTPLSAPEKSFFLPLRIGRKGHIIQKTSSRRSFRPHISAHLCISEGDNIGEGNAKKILRRTN